jgi:Icc protein
MHQSPHNIHFIEAPGDVVRVVQLTDTHLCQAKGGTLLGMDTDQSLQAVIELAQDERPAIDMLLGTGDLSDRGAREAYERLQAYFSQIPCDHFWLPGNHDDRNAMEAAANTATRLCKEVRASRWQILMLDSQVPGEVGGELGQAELALLEQTLQSARDEGLYTLVCLHHQPVTIGCAWLDEQMVADATAFFDVLDRYPGVRGVLWGHVHQQIDWQRKGVSLMASPSTCVQFAPGSVNFKADNMQPGYRWLDLHGDGRIETAVSRLSDEQFTVEPGSRGYL